MTKDDAWEMIDSALDSCYSEKDVLTIKEALVQPAWVSLTEEDKDSFYLPFGYYDVINVIEAKLKEKNGV